MEGTILSYFFILRLLRSIYSLGVWEEIGSFKEFEKCFAANVYRSRKAKRNVVSFENLSIFCDKKLANF